MLTRNKNVDLYVILMNLDDESLLNFCKSAVKQEYEKSLCADEKFWKLRTKNYYPVAYEIKKDDLKWKNYYLRIVYYKDKIRIEYGLDFTDGDAKDYYIELGEKTKKNPSYNLAKAMEENRQDLQTILRIKYPNIDIIHLKYADAEFYYDKNLTSFIPIPQGKYKTFYPDGKIRREGNYLDGIKIGEWKSYYQNGKLNSINNYKKNNQEEILDGEQIKYNDDGTVEIYEMWKNNAMIERKFM